MNYLKIGLKVYKKCPKFMKILIQILSTIRITQEVKSSKFLNATNT